MESDTEARVRREKEFHDARFADGEGRRTSSAFYRAADPSKQRLAELVDRIEAGSKVLELGCGADSVAWDLWDRGVEVTGIDIAAAAIEVARSKATERGIDPDHFRVGNAEQLEFAPNTFDAVIGSSILHHLELESALEGIRDVLKPDGVGLFYEPLGRNPAINLYRRLTPSERSVDEHPLVAKDFEFLRRNFDEVELEYFHLTSLAALPLLRTRAFAPVHERLERSDQWLFERFPSTRSFAWVVVISCRPGRAGA